MNGASDVTYAAVIENRLRHIEKHKDRLVEAWIAETGLRPSDTRLVIQNCDDGQQRIWVERVGQATMAQQRDAALASCRSKDIALEDMRRELSEARQERDRYVARMKDLEARLDVVREVVGS